MTKLEVIQARLAQAQPTKATKATAKANSKITVQEEQHEIVEQQEIQEEMLVNGHKIVTDFFQDLTGAERLVRKYVKKWNSLGNGGTVLQPTDKDEAVSRVYLAVIQTEHTEDDIEMWETSKQYFGIETLQQYRKGWNAFRKMMRENSQNAIKAEYNQDFGTTGTHTTTEEQADRNELDEIELQMTLKTILDEKQYQILTLKLQGYKIHEIAEETGLGTATVERRNREIRQILTIAYDIK